MNIYINQHKKKEQAMPHNQQPTLSETISDASEINTWDRQRSTEQLQSFVLRLSQQNTEAI